MSTALVDYKDVAALLQDVVAHPERYRVVQSDCDTGTASLATIGDRQIPYNKLSISITFVDKAELEPKSGESV